MTRQEECIQYIKQFLKEKKCQIVFESEDNIQFKVRDITYVIFMEDTDNVTYGIDHIDGVNLDSEFFKQFDEQYDAEDYEDSKHIDDWFMYVVTQKKYSYIKKIWNALKKLDEEYEDLETIAGEYFERKLG